MGLDLESLLYIFVQDDCFQIWLRSNRNSHSLLVGMKNDTVTLENCLDISYKPRHTPAIQSRINQFSLIQSLSHVKLFATPWMEAHQDFLYITNSWSLHKFMSIESVKPSNHRILCGPLLSCLQSFLASGSFPVSQFFASGGQSIGVSASASVLPMHIQAWFDLGWTGSPCSPRDS